MSKTILKRSLALGLDLELIWVRPLVFTQINQGQQNAGVILKIIKKKKSYYGRYIAIPVMDNLINNLEHRMVQPVTICLFIKTI